MRDAIYKLDFEQNARRGIAKLPEPLKTQLTEYLNFKIENYNIKGKRQSKLIYVLAFITNRMKITDLNTITEEKAKAFFIEQKDKTRPDTLIDKKVILGDALRFIQKLDDKTTPSQLKFLSKWRLRPQKKDQPILNEQDIIQIIDAFLHIRDKALLSIIWQTGCRIGEALNLQHGDIENLNNEKREWRLHLDGKTGKRAILFVDKWGYFAQLIRIQQKKQDFGFIFKTKGGGRQYFAFAKVLKEAAKRAGIEKPHNFHWIRHSRATLFAGKNIPYHALNSFMGWTPGSNMAGTYLHTDARMADSFIRAAENSDEFIRKKCSELETCDGREENILFERFADKFMDKFGDQLMARLAENQTLLNELERLLTYEGFAPARTSQKKINAVKTQSGAIRAKNKP